MARACIVFASGPRDIPGKPPGIGWAPLAPGSPGIAVEPGICTGDGCDPGGGRDTGGGRDAGGVFEVGGVDGKAPLGETPDGA